jgi:glycolate oxidase FAD binding subunit
MAVSAPALRDALDRLAGGEPVVSDPSALARYAVDGVTPRWVARPASVAALSALLTFAHTEGLAVAPRGSASSLALGNPPRRLDLVLDLTGLDRVIDYVPEDLVATVEAGMTLGALGRTLAAHGQMLALDPIGAAARTIGGVLATNASGPQRFRYGTGRDMLLGVRFAQADGTITWGGSRVVKSVTGYDVPKLLVGSLGTLGVIAEATLRLHPVPPASRSWRFGFDSSSAAANFLAALLDSSLEPDRVALLGGDAARASGHGGGGTAVLISVSSVEDAVQKQGEALAGLAAAHGGAVAVAQESSWSAVDAMGGTPVALKLTCEPSRLVSWLDDVERRSVALGLRVSAVGQPGHGVLHVGLSGSVPAAATLHSDLLVPLRDAVAAEGGAVVVERAPAELKANLEVWGPIDPTSLAIMARLKREFDPRQTLNPGRFVGGL